LAEITPKGVSGISISWYNIGTTQLEISCYTTTNLEKPTPLSFLGYQSAKGHVFYSDFTVETFNLL
jgi:hypothetical protein